MNKWAKDFSDYHRLNMEASEQLAEKLREIVTTCEDLAVSADTAELMLRETHPAEAQSLGAKVTKAKQILESLKG